MYQQWHHETFGTIKKDGKLGEMELSAIEKQDLQNSIHWWVFGVAGIDAILIAMLTVSSQAVCQIK